MYLIGPTSASSFLYSASIVNFSSVNTSSSVFAVLILRFCSSIIASISTPVSVPSCLRKRSISLLLSSISNSALALSLFTSSLAVVFNSSICTNKVCFFVSSPSLNSLTALAVPLPYLPSGLAPTNCCNNFTESLSLVSILDIEASFCNSTSIALI